MVDLKGRVLGLAELLDYQEGSVVSRELVKLPTGSLTVFAFDAGQGLSEHTAPFDATVLMVEGEAEVSISGTPQTVKAGELLILPAGVPHAVNALKPFKMLLIMIRS